jgi:hypothetical protein
MNPEDSKSLARLRREATLADLRDGRRRRATTFRSAKDYRRKGKHGHDWT